MGNAAVKCFLSPLLTSHRPDNHSVVGHPSQGEELFLNAHHLTHRLTHHPENQCPQGGALGVGCVALFWKGCGIPRLVEAESKSVVHLTQHLRLKAKLGLCLLFNLQKILKV